MTGARPHPMSGHDAFRPGEIATSVETRGVAKAEAATITTFVLALVAAAFIAVAWFVSLRPVARGAER
ncbi:MAG TPA: hypothetical protein VF036_02330 [Actinomycetota bacterium]